MKKIRSISTLTALAAASAVAVAGPASAGPQGSAASAGAKKDIVETAVEAGQFNTLASLLKKAGLVKTLKGKGPYTVFAPTDAAFAKVPQGDPRCARPGQGEAPLGPALPRRRAEADRGQDREAPLGQDAQRPARPHPRPRRDRARRRRPRHHGGRRRLQRRHPRHQQGPDPPLGLPGSPARPRRAGHERGGHAGRAKRGTRRGTQLSARPARHHAPPQESAFRSVGHAE